MIIRWFRFEEKFIRAFVTLRLGRKPINEVNGSQNAIPLKT